MKEDIRVIVGGNFTPDALSPATYESVSERVRRRPTEYLRVFERLFLGMCFDALAQSELYLPRFLEEVRKGAPQEVDERVKEVAAWLLKRYEAVLIMYDEAESEQAVLSLVPDETARLIRRLNDRRDRLCVLTEPSAC